jgi:hypothetical protein
MVRLWFETARARPILMEALTAVPGLRLVTAEDKARHRIAGCRPSNAHEIFLADPGVVISPDFFSAGSTRPLGMHGYDPDCHDNQGIFVVSAVDVPSGDAGLVDATEIYHWTRELVGLARPRPDRVAVRASHTRGRFTQSTLPLADVRVADQLNAVVVELEPIVADAEAIVLTGSFGRGEGGAMATAGVVSALNDFDVLVVGGPDVSRELAGASATLAARVGLDFLDLAWADGAWTDLPATMLNVDIRYGSQVLRGDAGVLDRMPVVAAADITMQDAQTLLINRIGGLLSGLAASVIETAARDEHDRRYLVNQIVKALVAVGDSYLVEWRAYDASYRGRQDRFRCLAPGAGVPDAVSDAVDCAYRLKVWPDCEEISEPVAAAASAASLILARLNDVVAQVFARPCASERDVMALLRGVTGEWVSVDNARLIAKPEIARRAALRQQSRVSIRQDVYAAMPMLLADVTRPGFRTTQSAPAIAPWLSNTLQVEAASSWEMVRATVVAVWLAMNH